MTAIPRLQVARNLAEQMHGDQRRRDGSTTFDHVCVVAESCRAFGESAQIVAYLHDTLEDTGLDPAVIEGLFGSEVRVDVEMLTRDDERETYVDYIDRVRRRGSSRAVHVKLCDLKHNLKVEGAPDWHRPLRERYLRAADVLIRELQYRSVEP